MNFSLYTAQDVPASEVLEIIEFCDPMFAKLTQYTNWEDNHRIDMPE